MSYEYTHQNRLTPFHFTWLVYVERTWRPFAISNQHKLEQRLGENGTFVDIEDNLFPGVKRVRVFPKANYLSYLGVKYRLCTVMHPPRFEFTDRHIHTNTYEIEPETCTLPPIHSPT